jgi:hypothetical protein
MMRCNKRGDFGFVWIFSIIAGTSILILSIYGATQIGETQRTETDASIAKKLTVLTDPLEAGFASAVYGTIKFQQETRIQNLCNPIGFGDNYIAASSESGVGKKFLEFSPGTTIKEKYLFGHEEDAGKTFYVFSKPFEFPYKIADFLIMISDKQDYCFIDAPDYVQKELDALDIPIVFFEDCEKESGFVRVCFRAGSNCDILVSGNCDSCREVYETGTVELEDDSIVEYAGSLMYAAIFSDDVNYDCNVRRLLYRGSVVAKILARKASLMNARRCSTNLEPVLYGWSSELGNATVDDVIDLYSSAVEIDDASQWEVCNVWE